VVKRIQFLVEKGLTSMMVLFDFQYPRIVPRQQCACVAWLYTEKNNAMQLEHDKGTYLDLKVLDKMLLKLSSDWISDVLVNPSPSCLPFFMDQVLRSNLLKEMPTLDDIDVTVKQVGDASRGVQIPRMDVASG
jgi:hypothetical protein